jgi:transcriptional regulator with XRE-family HTH domain
MAERQVPSVRGRQLARELRGLRATSGLTGEQVASELGWSSAKVSRVETARSSITQADLRKLLAVYGPNAATVERLLDLARSAGERGWSQAYAETMNPDYMAFIGLEDEAASMSCYQMNVVNGLLQTERYARAIVETGGPYPHGEVERRLQVRLTRQRRLVGSDVLDLWFVLDEFALRRIIGGPDIMAEQIAHLMELTERPNIKIQILPHHVGAHSALASSFMIFKFNHPDDPPVVAIETMVSHHFVEDDVQVFRYTRSFDELCGKALDFAESVEFLAALDTQ